MTINVRTNGVWQRVDYPHISIGGEFIPVVRASVYVNGAWQKFYPDIEPTVTIILTGLEESDWPLLLAQPQVVTGTVTAAAGPVTGGTVTLFQRLVGEDDLSWVAIGSAAVSSPGTPVVNWSLTAVPTLCGESEFKAEFDGTAANTPSTSDLKEGPVILDAVGVLSGDALDTTTATLSWAAVPGALLYGVYRDGVLVGQPTVPTFTDTGLTPATTYSWQVLAAVSSECYGAASPPKSGTTGQDSVTDTGTATIEIRPEKTNSYRNDVDWGYVGERVAQGYYSTSSRNYSGTIDYGTPEELAAKAAEALGEKGDTRYDNLVVSAAAVYLHKRSGVGAGGPVTVSFYNSPAEAGAVDAEPVRNGTKVDDTTASGGSGKWQNIGLEHWGALYAGTARSIVTYNYGTANYAQFEGKSSAADRCNLRLDCSWDYVYSVEIPPVWNN